MDDADFTALLRAGGEHPSTTRHAYVASAVREALGVRLAPPHDDGAIVGTRGAAAGPSAGGPYWADRQLAAVRVGFREHAAAALLQGEAGSLRFGILRPLHMMHCVRVQSGALRTRQSLCAVMANLRQMKTRR